MNNALNHVSWAAFMISVAILMIIYYLIVGLKFYRAELRVLINKYSRKSQSEGRFPEALVYEDPDATTAPTLPEPEISYVAETDDIPQTEEFIGRVRREIAQAATKAYSPALLIDSLQMLFTAYPEIKSAPHRAAISELIASECEQTGTAQLSEYEVDAWWDSLPAVPQPGPGGHQAIT